MSTPMAYGFGTANEGVSVDAVRELVRSLEAQRRRRPSGTTPERADDREKEVQDGFQQLSKILIKLKDYLIHMYKLMILK